MVEETTTQYLEYLYDLPSDEDNDWRIEEYSYEVSKIKLEIQTRYSSTGVSRSTWEAAFVMGKFIEEKYKSIIGQQMNVRVLELGSGTGLGGIHLAKLLEKHQV